MNIINQNDLMNSVNTLTIIAYTAKLLFHQSSTRHSDYTVTTTVTM